MVMVVVVGWLAVGGLARFDATTAPLRQRAPSRPFFLPVSHARIPFSPLFGLSDVLALLSLLRVPLAFSLFPPFPFSFVPSAGWLRRDGSQAKAEPSGPPRRCGTRRSTPTTTSRKRVQRPPAPLERTDGAGAALGDGA